MSALRLSAADGVSAARRSASSARAGDTALPSLNIFDGLGHLANPAAAPANRAPRRRGVAAGKSSFIATGHALQRGSDATRHGRSTKSRACAAVTTPANDQGIAGSIPRPAPSGRRCRRRCRSPSSTSCVARRRGDNFGCGLPKPGPGPLIGESKPEPSFLTDIDEVDGTSSLPFDPCRLERSLPFTSGLIGCITILGWHVGVDPVVVVVAVAIALASRAHRGALLWGIAGRDAALRRRGVRSSLTMPSASPPAVPEFDLLLLFEWRLDASSREPKKSGTPSSPMKLRQIRA